MSTATLFPSDPSPKLQTIIAHLDAFHNRDVEGVLAQFSESSFEYFTLPESVPNAQSYLTKDAYAKMLREVMPKLEAYKLVRLCQSCT